MVTCDCCGIAVHQVPPRCVERAACRCIVGQTCAQRHLSPGADWQLLLFQLLTVLAVLGSTLGGSASAAPGCGIPSRNTTLHLPLQPSRCCMTPAPSLRPLPTLQSCYGIMELPGPDEVWLCRACELQEEGKPPPQVRGRQSPVAGPSGSPLGGGHRAQARGHGVGQGGHHCEGCMCVCMHRCLAAPAGMAASGKPAPLHPPCPCSAACARWWAAR